MSLPYGRRPPYTRRDRLGFTCTMWLIAFGAILAFAVMFSIPAHSEPLDVNSTIYAARNAPAVCEVLTVYPSLPGLEGVIQGVENDGFTATQAGGIVAIAVQAKCPRFDGLLQQFIDWYAPPSTPPTPPAIKAQVMA